MKRILPAAIGLLLSADAFAGDYSLSYAFDGTTREDVAAGVTSTLNEEGITRECQYEKPCTIELTKSDLTISLRVERLGYHDEVMVFAHRGRSLGAGCCYFSGDDRLVSGSLPSHCFASGSTKGKLARETNTFKIFPWDFCICSSRT
ncbi:hypothetical protein [Bradyrhizobium sp. USDA 4448]